MNASIFHKNRNMALQCSTCLEREMFRVMYFEKLIFKLEKRWNTDNEDTKLSIVVRGSVRNKRISSVYAVVL